MQETKTQDRRRCGYSRVPGVTQHPAPYLSKTPRGERGNKVPHVLTDAPAQTYCDTQAHKAWRACCYELRHGAVGWPSDSAAVVRRTSTSAARKVMAHLEARGCTCKRACARIKHSMVVVCALRTGDSKVTRCYSLGRWNLTRTSWSTTMGKGRRSAGRCRLPPNCRRLCAHPPMGRIHAGPTLSDIVVNSAGHSSAVQRPE